jgi:hypothetical protein
VEEGTKGRRGNKASAGLSSLHVRGNPHGANNERGHHARQKAKPAYALIC